MQTGVTVLALVGLALCVLTVIADLVYLATGRLAYPLRRQFRDRSPRAAALSSLCSCLGGCIVTGTIATGWVRSHPGADLAIAVPIFWALLGLSFFFARRSRLSTRESHS
jgi:hypothetical protein